MRAKAVVNAIKAGKNKNAMVRSVATFSGNLSYSSPESDFYNSFVRSELNSSLQAWSRSFSYAAPEADFYAARRELHLDTVAGETSAEWSGSLSFASPEADFTTTPHDATTWAPNAPPVFSPTVDKAEVEWSRNLSFASPESDFTANPRATEWEWSSSLSFTSPEADFTAHPEATQEREWSKNLSFASPEADFSAHPEAPMHEKEWSSSLSFASPETDFTAQPETAHDWEWSSSLSFSSPEADYTSQAITQNWERSHSFAMPESDFSLHTSIMNLAVSSPESASGSVHAHQLLDRRELYQLHHQVLPLTIDEALADKNRAIVVTEAHDPFKIVDVNDVWVGLCGFSKEEARHASLAIIQGPETNKRALILMMDELIKGNEATAVVTNYNKEGRKFYNQLQAGPIRDSDDRITHFVGILREISEQPETMHMAA